MSRVSRMVVVAAMATAVLAACGDPVKQAKNAAEVRGGIENALLRMEASGEVLGLEHRHVTVEPDSDIDGFAIKVYDMKLGTAEIGFQSFREMTFSLSRGTAAHLTAVNFKFKPKPVAKASADALVEHLKTVTAAIQISD